MPVGFGLTAVGGSGGKFGLFLLASRWASIMTICCSGVRATCCCCCATGCGVVGVPPKPKPPLPTLAATGVPP